MPLIDSLLPEFDREMGLTRRALERVPDGQFDFKPHPTSVTLGRLAEHLTEMPQWATITMTQTGIEMTTAASARVRAAGDARGRARAVRHLPEGRPRQRRRQDRRRVSRAVDAESRRQGSVHDAEDRGDAELRAEPHDSSPRPATRVPADARSAGAVDLRTLGGRDRCRGGNVTKRRDAAILPRSSWPPRCAR